MKSPTPPDARGVGTKSKTYPGMQEKDPFSFEFVILVSVTPIKLNWKSSSSSSNVKFSKFWLMLTTLLWKTEKLDWTSLLDSFLLNNLKLCGDKYQKYRHCLCSLLLSFNWPSRLVNRSRSNKLGNLSRCLLHWEVVDTELLSSKYKKMTVLPNFLLGSFLNFLVYCKSMDVLQPLLPVLILWLSSFWHVRWNHESIALRIYI